MFSRLSSSWSSSVWLIRAGSIVAFAGGAVLLMADSANCPDGYATTGFDATYHSSCPSSGAGDGTVHLAVAGDKDTELVQALRAGGLLVDGVEIRTSDSSKGQCASTSFTFHFDAAATRPKLTCQAIALGSDTNRIVCSSGMLDPAALRIGKRDLEDGSTGDAQTSDASPDAKATTSDSGIIAAPTSSSTPLQPPPGDTTCVINFTRMARP